MFRGHDFQLVVHVATHVQQQPVADQPVSHLLEDEAVKSEEMGTSPARHQAREVRAVRGKQNILQRVRTIRVTIGWSWCFQLTSAYRHGASKAPIKCFRCEALPRAFRSRTSVRANVQLKAGLRPQLGALDLLTGQRDKLNCLQLFEFRELTREHCR
ncbi:hypothetical protein K402DRAFT_230224 [Aulographum hederae CBS 113979]|uniref:Uncharacterized protein n=1 Tax=Aulographum hederae CBS 113979 TaxID=1176131 RepID=A0A6G1HBR0_9PEZI|nr:hypothetical protein K402DRAFT_230224 [Aulographum hederae CBS 113979]